MAEWFKASVLKTDGSLGLLVGSNPTLPEGKNQIEKMRGYQKKLIQRKINHIFQTNKYILIGRYDGGQPFFWKDFKKEVGLFIPKNSLCRLVLNTDSKGLWQTPPELVMQNVFGGPIFILFTQDSEKLKTVLMKLTEAKTHVYLGLLDGQLLNFIDIHQLYSLLRDPNSNGTSALQIFSCVSGFHRCFLKALMLPFFSLRVANEKRNEN